MYIFVTPTKTRDSSNIPYQQCIIYWQSKCKISSKSAKANNSYSNFCEVKPKHFSFTSCVWRNPQKPWTEVFWGHLT